MKMIKNVFRVYFESEESDCYFETELSLKEFKKVLYKYNRAYFGGVFDGGIDDYCIAHNIDCQSTLYIVTITC